MSSHDHLGIGGGEMRWFQRSATVVVAVAIGAAAAGAQRYTIDSKPTVVIGADGAANATLRGVIGAFRATSGHIAVVEAAGPTPIRLFTERGAFEKTIARAGGGPGEIEILYWAGRAGDSIVTFDFALSRVSTFDLRSGENTSTLVRFRNAPSRPSVEGLIPPTTMLVVGVPRPFPRTHEDGAFRDSSYVGLANWGNDSVTILGSFARLAVFARNGIPGPVPTRFSFDSLTPLTTILAHDGRVIVADPQAANVIVFDSKGKRMAAIQPPFPPSSFNAAELEKGKRRALKGAKQLGDSMFRQAMYNLDFRPKSAPRYKRIIPGPAGELWFERYWVDEAAPREFAVVNRAGKVIAHASGPPSVRFTEFGRDYALGVAVDADGVETVVEYRLSR